MPVKGLTAAFVIDQRVINDTPRPNRNKRKRMER